MRNQHTQSFHQYTLGSEDLQPENEAEPIKPNGQNEQKLGRCVRKTIHPFNQIIVRYQVERVPSPIHQTVPVVVHRSYTA